MLLLLSCAVSCGADLSATNQVRLQVKDAATQKPVQLAAVYVVCASPNPYDTNIIYFTAADGAVSLPFYKQPCLVTITREGYAVAQARFDSPTNITVHLKKASK